ncbi:MAG: LysR family transcriptional regulator [Lachnospiraceae bacterium]|nr:LysR family transcriptional regulator [Lachnospiraceae bacterium]
MDINKYTLFADVAETHNFTKSGERLGYTQPGVSHILKSLENELGFPLFIRTRHGVELTPNAKMFLPIVRELIAVNEELEQTVSSLKGLDMGHLTIAAYSSVSRIWLPPILYKFQQKYPNIMIEVLQGGTDEIVDMVTNHIADFGLMSKRHTSPLKWIPLYREPLMAILPKDDSHAADTTFSIQEFRNLPFIRSTDGVDYDVLSAIKDSGIHMNIHYQSRDDHTIVSMVANHLGYSILPSLVIRGVENQIAALPLDPFYDRELGIALRAHEHLSPAALRFTQEVADDLPEILKAEDVLVTSMASEMTLPKEAEPTEESFN